MIGDDEIGVKFGGATDGLEDALKKATSALDSGVSAMIGKLTSLGSVAGGVGGIVAGAFAALTSGALFQASIKEVADLGWQVEDLGRRFNLTSREATALSFAIGDAYLTVGEFTKAGDMMMRQMRSNEDVLKTLGVVTRDSNGALVGQKDLLFNGLNALREYKQGTDQLMAAQAIFGARMDEDVLKKMMEAQEYFEQTKDVADEFGRTLGVENVKAAEDYRTASRAMGDSLQGVRITIGNALLPVWNDWMTNISNAVRSSIPALNGVMRVLGVTLLWLSQIVYGLFQVFKSLFQTVGQAVAGIAAVVNQLVSGGGWSGAKAAWEAMTDDMSATWNENADNIKAKTEELQRAMKNVWEGAEASADQKIGNPEGRSGGKTFIDPLQAERNASELMQLYKRQLAELKNTEGDYQEFSKAKEVEFWAAKRDTFAKGTKQWQEANILYLQARRAYAAEGVEIARFELDQELAAAQGNAGEKVRLAEGWLARMAVLYGADSAQYRAALKDKLAADREFVAQQKQIQDIQAKATLAARLADLEAAKQIIDARVSMGTLEKSEAYAMQEQIIRDRYQLQLQEIERRKVLYADDLVQVAQLNAEKLALETQMRNELILLHQGQQTAVYEMWTNMFQGIFSSFENVLYGLLTRTMTWRQALQQILGSVLQMFIKLGMDKLKAWITSEVLMTKVTQLYNVIRNAFDAQGAATSVAVKTSETTAKVTQSAGAAAAGAAESQAAIPVVGPAMAAAAAAAMMALVMGFASGGSSGGSGAPSIPSAAGGWWEVPGDTLAMIHKREMVMPGDLAEGVRTMVENGGAGGGDQFHVHAVDADSVVNLFKRNGDALFDVVKGRLKNQRSYG